MPPKAIFKGQTFALSGKLAQPQKTYEELIIKWGGEFATSVTGAVSFLISTEDDVKANTGKVASALKKGVPIVGEGYLGACVTAKSLLDSKKFLITKKPVAKRAAPKAAREPAAKKAKAAVAAATTDKVAVIAKSGLADSAEIVTEKIKKGFAEGELTWDVELVQTDVGAYKDKFYNIQLVKKKDDDTYVTIQNWGKTGMDGAVKLAGPFADIDPAKRIFRKVYRQKTGNVFGFIGSTFIEVAGKYRLLAKEEEVAAAAVAAGRPVPARAGKGRWQYYLHNKVDGKKLGWYDYEKKAGENMEKYWGQFNRDDKLNVRIVHSGYFAYEVDFTAMTQLNVKSGMRRVVRRLEPGEKGSTDAPEKIPEKAAPAPDWKGADSSGEEDDDDDEDDADASDAEEDAAAEAAPAEMEADYEEGEGEGEAAEAPAPAAGGRAPPKVAAPAPAGGRAPPPAEAAPAAAGGGRAAPPAAAAPAAGGRAPPPAAGGRAPPPAAEADAEAADETMVAETLPMRGGAPPPME